MTELSRFAVAAGIISFGDDDGTTVSADTVGATFFRAIFLTLKVKKNIDIETAYYLPVAIVVPKSTFKVNLQKLHSFIFFILYFYKFFGSIPLESGELVSRYHPSA